MKDLVDIFEASDPDDLDAETEDCDEVEDFDYFNPICAVHDGWVSQFTVSETHRL